jgi:hypothetical protein
VAFGEKPTLFMASQPRALLENLQIARARIHDEPKILTQEALERWLDRQLRSFGGSWLDDTQGQVSAIADRLGWQREKTEFDALATALRGKSSAFVLVSDVAKARAEGRPYDPDRDLLFRNLQARLANETFKELPGPPVAERENRAFWEAYFSNYIEGTKFTVEDAQTIVFAPDTSPAAQKRPADAHDVRETYRLIVDNRICSDTPPGPADFLDLLKRRHARMMASRPHVQSSRVPSFCPTGTRHFHVRTCMANRTLSEIADSSSSFRTICPRRGTPFLRWEWSYLPLGNECRTRLRSPDAPDTSNGASHRLLGRP